jgi:hypothetical protein
VILVDLGWRLELRADSTIPGLGRLEAVAYQRSREEDWMVSTRQQREPHAVPSKEAAVAELERMMQS